MFPFSMLEGNLSKTEKLNFYIVEDEYIEYDIINSNKENKTTSFYKILCCNYRLLKEKLADYKKISNTRQII